MILGIGMDVVYLDGFREQLSDSSSEFTGQTFTAAERRTANARASADPERHLAVRFAAKEAFVKAWSSANFGKAPAISGLDWQEIEVLNDSFGRPTIVLHGQVAAALAELGSTRTHVSLSHDGPVASAYVVLEQIEESLTIERTDNAQTDRSQRRTA